MNKNLAISIILQLLLAGIYYYVFLPVINPTCFSFWLYVIALIINFSVITSIFTVSRRDLRVVEKFQDLPKLILLPMLAIFIIITGIMVVNIIVSPIFNAKSYSQRITVDESGEFTKDIAEVDFKKVPLLDRDSTEKLGDRVMGQNSDYVSQFYVSDDYTQINYNEDILRVTTLEYDGLIKWISNRGEGIKGYITVNSVNGEAKLVKLDLFKGLAKINFEKYKICEACVREK